MDMVNLNVSPEVDLIRSLVETGYPPPERLRTVIEVVQLANMDKVTASAAEEVVTAFFPDLKLSDVGGPVKKGRPKKSKPKGDK